jgi:hypothetical protein
MTGNVRHSCVVLAAAGLLALAGCNGDSKDQPRTLPPVTSTPTVSAQPQPTMPPEAKQHTREGAEAFARHFIDVTNHAQQTGDTTGVQTLADKDCGSCAQFISDVHEWYRDGSVRGGVLTITKAHTPPLRSGFTPTSVLEVEVSPVQRLDTEGTPTAPAQPRSSGQIIVDLRWGDAGWQVAEVRRTGGSAPT